MSNLKVDFSAIDGKVKPLHGTNNGPNGSIVRQTKGNFATWKEAGIPYSRMHDSSFCEVYGGEFSVDVHRIFPNFDADVNDPASYIFKWTDDYIQNTTSVGTKIFYRLGATIEHYGKKGTYPPKDYLKWAQICEHIIRHYNEGWANGYNYGIEYWEVWNEPDCENADGSNPCWQGTKEEYYLFYETASKYLKEKFPNLKIGGPALCGWGTNFEGEFFDYAEAHQIPFDFFSYHCYTSTVERVVSDTMNYKRVLEEHGYGDVEMILDEWNYIRSFLAEPYEYSLKNITKIKGASFFTGVLSAIHKTPVTKMMYYDARPSAYNGIFGSFGTLYKTYYALKAYNELYKLGKYVKSESDYQYIYSCAATNGKDEGAFLFTYFNDADNSEKKDVKIDFSNFAPGKKIKVEYYILNDEKDMEIFREETFSANEFSAYVSLNLYDVYFIRLKVVD